MGVNKVLYNVDQRADTTEEQKMTARRNIGAAREVKFWMCDPGGRSSWATIGDTVSGATVHLPIYWSDVQTAMSHTVHTNFTEGDPEAFPASDQSQWLIVLKKGLWRYTVNIELEPETLGTGNVDMRVCMRFRRENGVYALPDWLVVRSQLSPTNNAVQAKYTRVMTGTVYADQDPTYQNGELATCNDMNFDIDIEGACDAVYKFRMQSLMLERIGD